VIGLVTHGATVTIKGEIMASLYDYGLPQLNQNMMSMYSTMQQEKRNKVLENAQNIENTAAMFKLNNEMKREQMLDKDIMFSGFMEAKGASPSVIDRTNKYLQSLGYMDQVGRIKARNLPIALQTMNQDTNFQLGILQDNWNDAGQKMSVLDEEINKMREKGDPEKQQDLAAKIMQRENLKVKQYNIKGLMEKLTGRKPDTSLTEAEILSKGGPEAERYITNKQKLTTPKAPTVHTFTEGNNIVEKQWDEATGTWKVLSTGPRYKPDPGRGPTEYQLMSAATNLRKEFNNRPEIKEYNQMMPKIASIDKALIEAQKSGNKVAADQALITLFNKMTDPNSVVRESEYARTPENLSFVNKMRGKIAKMATGGAGLTNSDRQAIVNMAKQMQGAYQDVFDKTADEYAGYARGYGIQPNMIIGERRKSQPSSGIDLNAINAELERRKGK